MIAQKFVDEVYQMAMDGTTAHKQVRFIFDAVADMLKAHRFDECNEVLASIDVQLISIDQMMAFLTMTQGAFMFPLVHQKLPARNGYIKRCKAETTGRTNAKEASELFDGYAKPPTRRDLEMLGAM